MRRILVSVSSRNALTIVRALCQGVTPRRSTTARARNPPPPSALRKSRVNAAGKNTTIRAAARPRAVNCQANCSSNLTGYGINLWRMRRVALISTAITVLLLLSIAAVFAMRSIGLPLRFTVGEFPGGLSGGLSFLGVLMAGISLVSIAGVFTSIVLWSIDLALHREPHVSIDM